MIRNTVRNIVGAFVLIVTLGACVGVPPVNLVPIPSENIELVVGSNVNVAVNAVPNAFTPQVTWVSADETIAIVTSTGANTGRITGTQEGATTVTATVAGSSTELVYSVTVTPLPTAITAEILNAPESMVVGESATLSGVIRTVGGLEDAGVWSTVTNDVLNVNAATGNVTALVPGFGIVSFSSVADEDVTVAEIITVHAPTATTAPAADTASNPLGGNQPNVLFSTESITVDTGIVSSTLAFQDNAGVSIPIDPLDPTIVIPSGGAIDVTVSNARLGSIVRVIVDGAATYERVTGETTSVQVGVGSVNVASSSTTDSFIRVDAITEDGAEAFAFGFRTVASDEPAVFAIDVTWLSEPAVIGEATEPNVVIRGWRLPIPTPYAITAETPNVTVNGTTVTGTAPGVGTIRVTALGYSVTKNILIVAAPEDLPPGFITAIQNESGAVTVTWEDVGEVTLERLIDDGGWDVVFVGNSSEFTDADLTVGSTVQYRVRTESDTPSEYVTSEPLLVQGNPLAATITNAAFVVSGVDVKAVAAAGGASLVSGDVSFELVVPSSAARPVSDVDVVMVVSHGGSSNTFEFAAAPYLASNVPVDAAVTVTVTVTNAFGNAVTTWSFSVPNAAPPVVELEVFASAPNELTMLWVPNGGGWLFARQVRVDDGDFGQRLIVEDSGSSTVGGLLAGSVVVVRGRYEQSFELGGVSVLSAGRWSSNSTMVLDAPATPSGVTAVADDDVVRVTWSDSGSVGRPVTVVMVESRRLDGPTGLNYDPSSCAAILVAATCAFDVLLLTDGEVDASGVGFSAVNTGAFTLSNVSFSTSADCIREHSGANVAVACLAPEDLFRFARVTFVRVSNADVVPVLGAASFLTEDGTEVDVAAYRLDSWDHVWVTASEDAGSEFSELLPRRGRSVEYRVKFVNSVGESGWVSAPVLVVP